MVVTTGTTWSATNPPISLGSSGIWNVSAESSVKAPQASADTVWAWPGAVVVAGAASSSSLQATRPEARAAVSSSPVPAAPRRRRVVERWGRAGRFVGIGAVLREGSVVVTPMGTREPWGDEGRLHVDRGGAGTTPDSQGTTVPVAASGADRGAHRSEPTKEPP